MSILMNGKRKPSKKIMIKIRIATRMKVKYFGDLVDEKIPLERDGEPAKGQNED